ncbi:hypothetical protein HJC23_002024 [Cyclotella cryptica]|uniref:Uncharacterized protein n=1 Tax=Cyclotella cryptica TaxID=29204 RepID=A0ABD3NTU1_9STRA
MSPMVPTIRYGTTITLLFEELRITERGSANKRENIPHHSNEQTPKESRPHPFPLHGFSLRENNDVSCGANPEGTHLAVDALRGGAAYSAVVEDVRPQTKAVILDFLASCARKNTSREFHIQGWRWHFMSLMRDSERLERLAKFLLYDIEGRDNSGLIALEQAVDYLVNFNMAGLHRVESSMFVQWLHDHLCNANVIGEFCGDDGNAVTDAFRDVIDKVNDHRVKSSQIGKELYERAKAASDESTTLHQRQERLNDIVKLSLQLSARLRLMRVLQETLVVPAIALVVPSGNQKSFNNRVLLNLGILESRVHLVGMHDAVWESGIESEKNKFEKEIPYVARVMIERWRKSLYDPKAGMLDYGIDKI